MLRLDANLMVPLLQVHLCKELRACHIVQQLVDARERILVLLGDVVQRAVVDAHSHAAILLAREKHSCTERASRRLHLACFEVRVELLLQLGIFRGGKPIYPVGWRLRALNKVNGVVCLSRDWKAQRELIREDVRELLKKFGDLWHCRGWRDLDCFMYLFSVHYSWLCRVSELLDLRTLLRGWFYGGGDIYIRGREKTSCRA